MGILKPGIKSRLEAVTEIVKTSYHVAFIPFVIYMGMLLYSINLNDEPLYYFKFS